MVHFELEFTNFESKIGDVHKIITFYNMIFVLDRIYAA
jgi:hypothetical protein